MCLRLIVIGILAALLPTFSPAQAAEQEDEILSCDDTSATHIIANIPARKMTVIHDGEVAFEFPVAVGAPGFKTPTGERYIKQVVWNPWWYPPPTSWAKNEKPTPPGPKNPLGPVKMEMDGDIRFHGTTNERSIGTAASHGCVRMYNEDAKILGWWLQTTFSDKTDQSLYYQYQKNRTTTYSVRLPSPIRVEFIYDDFEIAGGKFIAHPDIYARSDRKKKAYDFLLIHGYSPQDINEEILKKLLQDSQRKTASASLEDLTRPLVAQVQAAIH